MCQHHLKVKEVIKILRNGMVIHINSQTCHEMYAIMLWSDNNTPFIIS